MAESSRQRTLRSVKSLIAFGHRIGYLPFDVGAALVLRRASRNLAARILDRESVLRMIALEPKPRNRAMLMLLYDSGVRVSEPVGITSSDVQLRDGGCGQITVTGKGRKTRTILISPKTYSAIRVLSSGGPDVPVFRSKSERRLSKAWYGGLSGRHPCGPVSMLKSAHIGFVTPALPIRSTPGLLSISSSNSSAMRVSKRQRSTRMRVRTTASSGI